MSTKLCEKCKRRIKADAVSCVCGWSETGAQPVQKDGFTKCSAYGCPLAGNWSNAVTGENKQWWCFIHTASKLPLEMVTEQIKKMPEQRKALHAAFESRDRERYRVARINFISTVEREIEPREPGEDREELAA